MCGLSAGVKFWFKDFLEDVCTLPSVVVLIA